MVEVLYWQISASEAVRGVLQRPVQSRSAVYVVSRDGRGSFSRLCRASRIGVLADDPLAAKSTTTMRRPLLRWAMSDWPHDPDGEEGSEGMRKYGQAILAKKLDEDADFPLAKADFVEEHGDHPVRLNHERVVSVADIMDLVEETEFETMVEFHRAVGRAMRANDMWEITPEEIGS
jgi:hypothetical protein